MKRREEHSFDNSLTDLMSGVAVTFLLIAAVFMVQAFVARTKEAAAERVNKQELDAIRQKDLRAREFLEQLLQRFTTDQQMASVVEAAYDPTVDPYLLTLTLNRDRFLFPSEGCELTASMSVAVQTDLKSAVASLCEATGAKENILSIALEGHTDARPFFPRVPHCGAFVVRCADASTPNCAATGFENNVRLSGARAQNVFFDLRRAIDVEGELAKCLDRFFVVSGRGSVEARGLDETGRMRDRRVVIKVRVNAGASLVEQARL